MDAQRFQLACNLKEQGNLTESFEEFIKIANETEELTDKAAAFLYAAATLKMARQFESARTYLNQVKALLASLHIPGKDFVDERTLWLEIAVGFEEADTDSAEGRTEEALTKFQDLLFRFDVHLRQTSYRSDYEMIQTRRALILADLGRWSEAVPILEEAESFELEKGLINFHLGYCYVAVDEYFHGIPRLKKSLEMGLPPHLEYRAHCALGKAYHKLEEYSQAKTELEKGAHSADPSYIHQAQLWKWLEATCRHLGLKEEAEHYAQLAKPAS